MRQGKIYSFTRLITKYNVDFTIQLFDDDTNTHVYNDLGEKASPVDYPKEHCHGALIPPSDKEIYQSGGRIRTSDRILYLAESKHPVNVPVLPPKTKVFHKGKTYYVEGDGDFLDFGDFYRYVLKGVSVFDKN